MMKKIFVVLFVFVLGAFIPLLLLISMSDPCKEQDIIAWRLQERRILNTVMTLRNWTDHPFHITQVELDVDRFEDYIPKNPPAYNGLGTVDAKIGKTYPILEQNHDFASGKSG